MGSSPSVARPDDQRAHGVLKRIINYLTAHQEMVPNSRHFLSLKATVNYDFNTPVLRSPLVRVVTHDWLGIG